MMDYLPLRTTSTLSLWKKTVLRILFPEMAKAVNPALFEINKKQNCKNTLCALCVLCG